MKVLSLRGKTILLSSNTRNGLIASFIAFILCVLFGTTNNPVVWSIAQFFTRSGNVLFVVGALLLLSITALRQKRIDEATFVLVAALLIEVLIHFLKMTIGHWMPRPSGNIGGFPSGHTMMAFALAYLLAWKFPKLSVLWYAYAIAISWSRVALNAHYPYQVLGGALIGLASVIIMIMWREKPIPASISTPKSEAA